MDLLIIKILMVLLTIASIFIFETIEPSYFNMPSFTTRVSLRNLRDIFRFPLDANATTNNGLITFHLALCCDFRRKLIEIVHHLVYHTMDM